MSAGALTAWLGAFALTQVVEVPIYERVLARSAVRAHRLPNRLAIAFGASLLTHPLVFIALPRLWPGGYVGHIAAAEAFAVGVEALYLHYFGGVRHPLTWALLANVSSSAVGIASRQAFGWP